MKKKIIIIALCVVVAIAIGLTVWAALVNEWFSPVPEVKGLEVIEISHDRAVVRWEAKDEDRQVDISCRAKGATAFSDTVYDVGELTLEGLKHGTEYTVRAAYVDDDRIGETVRVTFETEYNPAADVAMGGVYSYLDGAADVYLDWDFIPEADSYIVRYKGGGQETWSESFETDSLSYVLKLEPAHGYDIEVVPVVEGYEGEGTVIGVETNTVDITAEYWVIDSVCCISWGYYYDVTYEVSCEDCTQPVVVQDGYTELELEPGRDHTIKIVATKGEYESEPLKMDVFMPYMPEIMGLELSEIDPWTVEATIEARGTQDGAWWELELKGAQSDWGEVYFDWDETVQTVQLAVIPGAEVTVTVGGKSAVIQMSQAETFTAWTFNGIEFFAEPEYSGWDGEDLKAQGAQIEFEPGAKIAAQIYFDAGEDQDYDRSFRQMMAMHRPDGTWTVISDYENNVDYDWESWHTWFKSGVVGSCEESGTYTVYVFVDTYLAGYGEFIIV